MSDHRISRAEVCNVSVSDKTIWRHVVLETYDGLVGTGEASLDRLGKDYDAELRSAAETLKGRRLADDTMTPLADLLGKGLTQRTVYSAIDQAVRDIRAQMAEQPLWSHLSGSNVDEPIELYANINRTTVDRSPQGFAANATRAAGHGYSAIKIAAFDDLTPQICDTVQGRDSIESGLARLRAVSQAAPQAEIMVDCHWRFTLKAAQDILPRLAEIGVVWFECPLPETPDTIEDLCALRRQANAHDIRLCGLETHGDWDHVAPYVLGGAYDVIMPDVKHAGGLRSIVEIAKNAARSGVAVSLHNPSGPIAHLASVHTAAAINSGERLESQWGESDLFFAITSPPPRLENGECRPASTPGLGAKLNVPG